MKSIAIAILLVVSFVTTMSAKSDPFSYITLVPQAIAGPLACKILGQQVDEYMYLIEPMSKELNKFKAQVNALAPVEKDELLSEIKIHVGFELKNFDKAGKNCESLLTTMRATDEIFN